MAMITQLTKRERQLAIGVLLLIACVGLAFAGAGKDDPLGVHGFLIMASAILGIFAVISGYFAPEPGKDRFDSYYDTPSKVGLLIAMGWAAFGLFIGDWVAWLALVGIACRFKRFARSQIRLHEL